MRKLNDQEKISKCIEEIKHTNKRIAELTHRLKELETRVQYIRQQDESTSRTYHDPLLDD